MGSPARAGIDLHLTLRLSCEACFPLTREDRPGRSTQKTYYATDEPDAGGESVRD